MIERKARHEGSLRKKILVAALVFLLLILVITTFFGRKGLLEIYRARKNYASLKEEIKRLEEEKTRLQREIEELLTNPEAVEKEAREKLWLMKPDEKVIVIQKN